MLERVGFDCEESLDPATECRAGGVGLAPTAPRPSPPLMDCLVAGVVFFGAGGGAMEGRPLVLNLDFALESEVLAVVAGVLVRGVEAVELAEDMGLVGDLVGDYGLGQYSFTLELWDTYPDRQPGPRR